MNCNVPSLAPSCHLCPIWILHRGFLPVFTIIFDKTKLNDASLPNDTWKNHLSVHYCSFHLLSDRPPASAPISLLFFPFIIELAITHSANAHRCWNSFLYGKKRSWFEPWFDGEDVSWPLEGKWILVCAYLRHKTWAFGTTARQMPLGRREFHSQCRHLNWTNDGGQTWNRKVVSAMPEWKMSRWGRRWKHVQASSEGFIGALCCDVCSKRIIRLKNTWESVGGYVQGPTTIYSFK